MKDEWIMEYKKPWTVDRYLLPSWGQQSSCVLNMLILTGVPLGAGFRGVLRCPVWGGGLLGIQCLLLLMISRLTLLLVLEVNFQLSYWISI